MERETAALLSAFLLILGSATAVFLLRRSLDARASTILTIASALALPLLLSGVQMLARSLAASLDAMPPGTSARLHLLVAFTTALLVIGLTWIPDRVARWAWILPAGLSLASLGMAGLPAALDVLGGVILVVMGLVLPRVAALAMARKAHVAEGGIAAAVLVLLFLPTLGSAFLGIVWTSDARYSLTWSAEFEPSSEGTWTVTIPFAQSESEAVAKLIERIRSDVRVVSGDATFRTAPDGRGLLIEGRGPAHLMGSTLYESTSGRYGVDAARMGETPWTLEGIDGMRVRWTLHEGCGGPLDHVETLGTFPAPSATPTPPTSPSSLGPCVHGD